MLLTCFFQIYNLTSKNAKKKKKPTQCFHVKSCVSAFFCVFKSAGENKS